MATYSASPQPFKGDPTKLRLGPASITFDNANLGYTLNDSVSIQIDQESTEIQPDQSALPLKDIITGMVLNVSMTLGEVTKDNLKLLPGFDNDGNLVNPMGVDLLDGAKELIVYPLSDADTLMYVFPKASPLMSGPMVFARETPQGLELNFKCYFDNSEDEGSEVAMYILDKPEGSANGGT